MPQVFYDTSKANELARFQGNFAGIQAGNSTVCGTAMAPTSIYNQAGYYALQDTDTGYINLQKLGNDSLYTHQWYDQGTGTIFDFSQNGTGITNVNGTNSSNSTNSSSNSNSASNKNNGTSNGSNSTNSTTNGSNTNGLQQYPWGSGYVTIPSNNGVSNTTGVNGNNIKVDEDGEQIQLTAQDLQELVDAGIYDSMEEALNATLKEGYGVSDEEQAKLGIYSQDDEDKIQLYMDKYGCTREEALEKLGGKVNPKDDYSDIETKLNNLINNGFERDEAVDYLEALGIKVPEELQKEPPKFSEEDEAKIQAVMQATGCSREEAIEATGVKPVKEKKPGLLRSIGKAIDGFVDGVCKTVSNAWNSFVDWIW